MKQEKDDYCRKEHARRVTELNNVASAEQIFTNVLNKLSIRVKLRTQTKAEGKAYGKTEEYDKAVRGAKSPTETGYEARLKERSEVAYL